MQGYDPGDIRSLQRIQPSPQERSETVMTVQLNPINDQNAAGYDSDDSDAMGAGLADYAELDYFCQASQSVVQSRGGAGQSKVKGSAILAQKSGGKTEDFIGLNSVEE